MGKKSLLDKITGKKTPNAVQSESVEEDVNSQPHEGGVDHMWMKEDIDAEKPKLEKNPRVDTGILRGRIAEKISKMNNN